MKLTKTILYTLVFILSQSVHAASTVKLDELFNVVDSAVYDELYAQNEFFIRKELYAAKKHRIVEINTNLMLQGKGSFTVTPFHDFKLYPSSWIQPCVLTRQIKSY
jgi:hypothetical protein